ncbi:MAG: hypothetical protein ACUVX8_00995 [Candidatus Zipacnadales bacterium]
MSNSLIAAIRQLLIECLSAPVVVPEGDPRQVAEQEIAHGTQLHNWNGKAEAFRRAACCLAQLSPDELPSLAYYPLALWAFNKSAALSRYAPHEAELHYLAYFWLTNQDSQVATQTAPTYPHGLKYYFCLATVTCGANYLAPVRTEAPVDVLRRLAFHPRPEVLRELRRMLKNLGVVSPHTLDDLKAAASSRSDYTPAQRSMVLSLFEPACERFTEMRCLLDEAIRIARTAPTQALGLVTRACELIGAKDDDEMSELVKELTRSASRLGDLGLTGRALVQVYLALQRLRPGEEMLVEGTLIQRFHEELKRAGGGAEGEISQFLADHPSLRDDLHLNDIPPEYPLTAEEASRQHTQGVAQGPNSEGAVQHFRLAVCLGALAPEVSLADFKHYVASFYASSARLNFRRGRWEEAERCYLVFFHLLFEDETLRMRVQPIIVPVLKYYLSLSFRARRTFAHIPVDRETTPWQLIERIRMSGDQAVVDALNTLLDKLEQANPFLAHELQDTEGGRHMFLADPRFRSSPGDESNL